MSKKYIKEHEFCLWLHGYFSIQEELSDGRGLGANQLRKIQEKLKHTMESDADRHAEHIKTFIAHKHQ